MQLNKLGHIAFLLGAGFSVPIGLPKANELGRKILYEIFQTIRAPFELWKDDGNNDFDIDEYKVLYSYIFSKVLINYGLYQNFDYEMFYDFLQQEKGKKLNERFLLSFIEFMKRKYSSKENAYNDINKLYKCILEEGSNYYMYVNDCISRYENIIANFLLGGSKNGKLEEFSYKYYHFVNILKYYLNQDCIIDIYTLNHDLILESLLSYTDLRDSVCDGFGGEIKEIGKKSYKVFDKNHFDKSICIYKLHGSIDTYGVFDTNDGHIKEYIKFVNGYSGENALWSKHNKMPTEKPLFLTGKISKKENYDKEPYKTMLQKFKANLGNTGNLIVIGYSGNDEVINKILDNYLHWNYTYIVSPDAPKHQFVKKYNAKPINKGIESLRINDIIKYDYSIC